MEIFGFSTSVRFRHPSMETQSITSALERQPKNVWQVGQERKQKNGARIGSGIYDETYWTSCPRRGEDSELIEVLTSDLKWLEEKRDFINAFTSTGGRISYYISWFASARSGGTEFSPLLLARLANLRVGLALDVYSSEQENIATKVNDPGREVPESA